MRARRQKRLDRFADTHRQVGAICHATAWLEGQLEEAAIELAQGSPYVRAMVAGQRASSVADAIQRFIKQGLVPESPWRDELEAVVRQAKTLVAKRDDAVHSTWLLHNQTPPGHVSAVRSRRAGVEQNVWHPDDLEDLRRSLEQVADDLVTLSWNAMTPVTGNLP